MNPPAQYNGGTNDYHLSDQESRIYRTYIGQIIEIVSQTDMRIIVKMRVLGQGTSCHDINVSTPPSCIPAVLTPAANDDLAHLFPPPPKTR